MPRPRKPRDEAGEIVETDVEPEANGTKPTKHGPERVSMSLKLATERHRRLLLQNTKLAIESKVRQGGLVELASMQRAVLAANHVVKQQVLSVIERANVPEPVRLQLRQQMVAALNELAYEGNHAPNDM